MSDIRKVKLVAIAKDEGCYLPEWIFHHLTFGFDSIDIYVNSTSDNSRDVLYKISKMYDVNIIEADKYREVSLNNFQQYVYKLALKGIDPKEFTHVAFLDIDEFWVPSDFKSNVKSFLVKNNKFDVSVFNWAFHLDEGDFSPCFKNSISVINDKHVKSIVKLGKKITPTIHSVLGNLRYGDCEGNEVFSEHPGKAHNFVKRNEVLSAFILHRAYRGEKEYVSLLGRGRPRGDLFKNNRFGYRRSNNSAYKILFESTLIENYYYNFNRFLNDCDLNVEKDISKKFVDYRYHHVLKLARGKLNYNDVQSLIIALRNVEINEVKEVLSLLNKKIVHNKIFQIGFNKCGTASIFHYMANNDFKSIHWDKGNLSRALDRNYNNGVPLLTGYDDYQVFTDMEHRGEDNKAYYSYQKYFKELDKQYPGSIFILNTRNIDKWIASRLKHPGYLDKTMKSTQLSQKEIVELWKTHFVEHVADVKSYFANKDNLITFDLDKDEPEKLYNELITRGIALKNKKLPHTHKTQKRNKKLSKKQEHVNTLRSMAIFFESSDIETSRDLMRVANKLRPEGKFIEEKLAEYEKILAQSIKM